MTDQHSAASDSSPESSTDAAGDPNAMYDVANALKNEGKVEEAVAQLKRVLEVDPDHLHSHLALGVHLQRLGQTEEALKHARRVTELEPNDPFSWSQLSVICVRAGRIEEAEEAKARSHEVAGRG